MAAQIVKWIIVSLIAFGAHFRGDFSSRPCTLTGGHAGDHMVRYEGGLVLPVTNYDAIAGVR